METFPNLLGRTFEPMGPTQQEYPTILFTSLSAAVRVAVQTVLYKIHYDVILRDNGIEKGIRKPLKKRWKKLRYKEYFSGQFRRLTAL